MMKFFLVMTQALDNQQVVEGQRVVEDQQVIKNKVNNRRHLRQMEFHSTTSTNKYQVTKNYQIKILPLL